MRQITESDRAATRFALWAMCLCATVLLLAACQPVMPVAQDAPAAANAEPADAEAQAAQTVAKPTPATVEEEVVEEAPVMDASAPVTMEVGAVLPTPAAATVDRALVGEGATVYRKAYCGVCHESATAETRGTFGPTHNGMGQIAVERIADPGYDGAATTPRDYILESLLTPEAYIVDGYAATSHRMPPFGHLDQASLDALVAFLLAQ
jgi:hypothetical protein